jgi:hypothetical protein
MNLMLSKPTIPYGQTRACSTFRVAPCRRSWLVSRALKPGGLHFASYKGGDIEGRDNHGRYFNFLSREELIDIYNRSAPWEIEWRL